MKKFRTTQILRSALSLLVAVALLMGTVPAVFAADKTAAQIQKEDSLIQLMDDLKVNYQDYLNSDVAFQLPDGVKADDEISVIIRYDLPSVMDAYDKTDKTMSLQEYATTEEAAQVIDRIRARQAAILTTLDEQGVTYKVGEEYNALFSGFELIIKGGDYSVTCMSMADGESVVLGGEYESMDAQLVENEVDVYETGIFNSSDVDYDGTGMVVAVLDTGLDSNHTAFSVNNFTSTQLGLTYDDVAKLVKKTKAYEWAEGLSVDDVYINNKVPFGYDYADNDPDVYSTHNNHGTHVSGVIVGKDDVITGVAPNAQLVSMKIFSDVEDTARSSWILAALEDCVILGVDVINMSLGTACGFDHESEEELLDGVYSRLRDAGIHVVVAASNSYNSAYGSEANGNLPLTSNPDSGTVGSPGTYPGTLSVASVNGVETPYLKYGKTIMYFDEANDNAGKEKNFFETILGEKKSMKVQYVTVPGVGRTADYTGLDVKGKIALVRRGSNTFEEKALIAEAQGAIGIIIYNNVSGEIKMNIGDATLAVCSISQDDGEVLAAKGTGSLTISKKQTSGPFMSDFSSWGPTPSLGIKPEITAHGGNILSSVTGGGYDRLSGTSMACPNTAGAALLLRQYVVENFPAIADNNSAVTAMVNRLMMSTADTLINTNGLPYAVRKQGAGLANLTSATTTPAVLITYDKDGKEMDTTKLELGDDPSKTGVYEMSFAIDNFSKRPLVYGVSASVLTEGVSETKTNSGKTTVTEQAYELEGAKVEVVSVEDGLLVGDYVTVSAGKQAKVTVRITLSDEDKQYLDESFENGMYVEGFVKLSPVLSGKVELSVPYLAFYGDWTQAPMLDLEYYETNADELDDGIDPEDKLMADSFASRPVGGISGDYVSYLGSYYFVQDPKDMVISANRNYIALSNQDGAIHSLRFVWAGMLRGAASIDISIINEATGEVVFETVDKDIRKSYGDGGSIRPSNIDVEFNMQDYNLPNNTKLKVKLVGHMDYGEDGIGANRNYTMEFPLTVDFEAPTITDVEYTAEYDKTTKKNKLYAKLAVYDNHYAMSGQLGYVIMGEDENGNETPELTAFEQYMTPIYSKENSTTYVTIDLTDYVYQIKDYAYNKNSFVFTTYDYCLNYASYEIRLPDAFTQFEFQGLEEGLKLSPNEVYTLQPLVSPEAAWSELLEFKSNKPSVVRVVNNKLVAGKSGSARISVTAPDSDLKYVFTVTVLKEGDEGYRRYDKPVADMFILTGYQTQKAYYILENEDKDLGDTGSKQFFEGNYNLSMYPSESVLLVSDIDPYFPRDIEVVYESSNENIVKVTATGQVTAVAEGFASVTMKLMQDGKSTYYSETVTVEVKDPYVVAGGILNHYYGLGGLVEIPARLRLKEIGNFAFANFEYIDKTPEELEIDDRETVKQWYIGDGTINKVVIPEGVEKINAYAFANLTALEEIVIPSTVTAIEYGAFVNCTSLKKITFSGENNLQIINQSAFERCDLEGKLDLSAACIISAYAFAGNKDLEAVVTGEDLLSIGQYAFAGCESLKDMTITAKLVKYGPYAFTACESLKSFYVNAAVLPEGMFYECKNMTSVTIGPDVNAIGEFAFRTTDIATFEVKSGNKAYKSGKNAYILSKNGKTLVAVAPAVKGVVNATTVGGGKITEIAAGAFSHGEAVTEVNLPEVTVVGDYAFGSATQIEKVTLGELKEVGEYAFFETAITELPKFTVKTEIGRYAFAFTDITEVTIPDKMEVAEGVFSECDKLTTVTVGNKVKLGKYAFGTDKDKAFKVESKDVDEKRYFYYTFSTALKNVTIGEDVEIGEMAFNNAASLEKVTLGKGAKLGKMAFYNAASLAEIDLSQVVEVGDYALSGDVYYMCLDDQMSVAAIDSNGRYMYTYHAPRITSANLASAKSVGEYAFAYCRDMVSITLGDKIDEVKSYTFAGCIALEKVNLKNIKKVGEYAFTECESLKKVDLSAAKEIGQYAFVYNKALTAVTFNAKGATIGEGAFSYCDKFTKAENLSNVTEIGNYAFAYSALAEADLTDAEKIGDHAFLKEEYTPFKVTLGKKLKEIGDNPFAMCVMEPFSQEKEQGSRENPTIVTITTFDLNKNVKVVDGSLYVKVPEGWELVVYLGSDLLNAAVEEDTVRVGSMAFVGSKAKIVSLPATVASVGHKAFYDCDSLKMVIFRSYDAPILEEAYDPAYYETYTHVPGTGDYGTYTDYDGNEVSITGEGIVPFFMWNATGGMYSNVLYGANFKDYVGYVKSKVAMIRPANGRNYDSYIYNHYFDMRLDGPVAADDTVVATIKAIKALPSKVEESHRTQIEAARALYDQIGSMEQKGLVTNYFDLVTAEQRLAALNAEEEAPEEQPEEEEKPANDYSWILWVLLAILLLILVPVVMLLLAAVIYMLAKGLISWKDISNRAKSVAKKAKPLAEKAAKTAAKAAKKAAKAAKKAAKEAEKVTKKAAKKAKKLAKKEKPAPAVEEVAEVPAEEVPAVEAPVEETPAPAIEEETPVQEAPAKALEDTANPTITQPVEEPVIEATPVEETAEETAPVEETPAEVIAEEAPVEEVAAPAKEKKTKKAKKAKKVKEVKNKKNRKPFPWRQIGLTILAIAGAVALISLISSMAGGLVAEKSPYAVNNSEGYTVSVKFVAGDGLAGDGVFTTGVSVMVDSFNVKDMTTDADGLVQLPLLDPNDNTRTDSYLAAKKGYQLVGWYAERTQTGTDSDGNPVYAYSKPWDFSTDRLAVDPAGDHSAAEPALTLYAAYANPFKVEFYDRASNTLLGTEEFNKEGTVLQIPTWDEKTGAMEMYKFAEKQGYTFDKAYLDAAGTQPVEGESLTHPGTFNKEDATVKDDVLKVYVDWIEGEWFHIYNVDQFLKTAKADGCYELHADLDFTGKYWPSQLTSKNFEGVIKGNGHVIRNVDLKQTSNNDMNVGLFGVLTEKAKITDLAFENITFTIQKGTRNVPASYGLLCGTLNEKATLTGVSFKDCVLAINTGSDCYFGTDAFSIGLLCGTGDVKGIDISSITVTKVGDQPDRFEVTNEEGSNVVILEIKE